VIWLGSLGVEARRIRVGNAEFVLGLAGRNLGVGLGVHVGIDAQSDARGVSQPRRNLAQGVELGFRLHVESMNALCQRIGHLFPGLAHAGKNDAIRRHACGPRAAQLAI
jgi:hypothetical protein